MGWDEDFQRDYHKKDFAPSDFQVILFAGKGVGVISIKHRADHVSLGEFYILPEYQRRGIGTFLIRQVIEDAQGRQLPVRLQFLKVNPVRRLYERMGFSIVGENEHYYQMERKAVLTQRKEMA